MNTFKIGDRFRRTRNHSIHGLPVGYESTVVRTDYNGVYDTAGYYHGGINLEKIGHDLEERLSQARAEVARIEAEIAEAAKPKVGDRYVTPEFDGGERYWILFGFHNGTAMMGREGTNVVRTLDTIVTYEQGRKVDK